jgi:hypothetical protein
MAHYAAANHPKWTGKRSVQFRPPAPSERTFLSRKNRFKEIAKLRKCLPKLREAQSPFLGQFCSVFSLGLPNALEGCVNALSFGHRVAQFSTISPKCMSNPYEFALRLSQGLCSRISVGRVVSCRTHCARKRVQLNFQCGIRVQLRPKLGDLTVRFGGGSQ